LEPTALVVGVTQSAIQTLEPTALVVGVTQSAIQTLETTALVVGVIQSALTRRTTILSHGAALFLTKTKNIVFLAL
jgi:flagellar biogenesis protein FliO